MSDRTDDPGFTSDEDVAELGSTLELPPGLEEDRAFVVQRLPPIEDGGPSEPTEAD